MIQILAQAIKDLATSGRLSEDSESAINEILDTSFDVSDDEDTSDVPTVPTRETVTEGNQ